MAYTIPFEIPRLTYDEALAYVNGLVVLGICPLLETVEEMLAELGDPDLCYDCVQIAGTNGKTSTARYTARILTGEGRRVGLYTSPQLIDYTERMEIGGSPVSREDFALGVAAACEAGERINRRRAQQGLTPYDVTEFDTLTVAACVVYALRGIDVAVLEVGMGGRWDATSAAKSIRSVAVTGIGLDHTRILGDTLEQIAHEKAAVIRNGRTCVLGVGTCTPPSVEDVFLDQAREQDVRPLLVRATHEQDVRSIVHPGAPRTHDDLACATFAITARPASLGTPLELTVRTPHATYVSLRAIKPAYQAANIACAVALAESYVGHALDAVQLVESIRSCPTPGRFDVVRDNPLGLVDACHNPQSVGVFLEAIDAMEPNVERRPTLLCAVLADKDVDGIVSLLAPAFPHVVVTRTSSARACSAHSLAQAFRAHGVEPKAVCERLEEAVGLLEHEPFVACGSITTAGEVAALYR
ncbi:MAG: Mur ligase family protein [Coriobacteriales bacterium]|nr:Mur ligase family protein [Coriobacteriales bacterium]